MKTTNGRRIVVVDFDRQPEERKPVGSYGSYGSMAGTHLLWALACVVAILVAWILC